MNVECLMFALVRIGIVTPLFRVKEMLIPRRFDLEFIGNVAYRITSKLRVIQVYYKIPKVYMLKVCR